MPRPRRLLPLLALVAGLLAAAPASAATFSPRIVGGAQATIEDFPYQVGLLSAGVSDPFYAQFCGGTVRDATHVITAAHCVLDDAGQARRPSEIDVFAGATRLTDTTAVRVPVSGISFMPDYDDQGTGAKDAALLTLATPLDLTGPRIAPVPLVAESESASWEPGDLSTVSGWGNTSTGSTPSYPDSLYAVDVPIVSDATCQELYAGYGGIVGPDMVCAGDVVDGGEDSCQGDSGGPLVVDADPDPAVDARRLAGIVSFGIGCAEKDFPGVYTEVASAPIRAFVTGSPPSAPANQAAPVISGAARAGSTLTCAPGTWSGDPAYTFQFARFDSPTDTIPEPASTASSSASYTLSSPDVGKVVACYVRAANAGGRALVRSEFTGPVEAGAVVQQAAAPVDQTSSRQIVPEPQRDTLPPTSSVYRKGCTRTTCTLNVAVVDLGYSLGIKALTGTLRTTYRSRCRRGRVLRRCTKVATRTLQPQAIGAGHYLVKAGRLRKGSHRFRFLAVDIAGNRQSNFLTVTLRTPPRR